MLRNRIFQFAAALCLLTCITAAGVKRTENNSLIFNHPVIAFDREEFSLEELEKELLRQINAFRREKGLDTLEVNEVMLKASTIQADFMANERKVGLDHSKGKFKTTAKRLQACGGTKNGQELVITMQVKKGKIEQTSREVADAIMAKWTKSKKDFPVLLNPNHIFTGITARLEEGNKKTYVSAVFGSYNSFNTGAGKAKRKEIKVKYSKKSRGIKPSDPPKCKNCEKFKDYNKLQQGLTVRENKIYLNYDDIKTLKRLLKKDKDGIAIDIIQRRQYDNPEYTITDNNLMTRGYLLKPVYAAKLYDKNLIKPEKKNKKVNQLEVVVGKLPKGLTEPYELNLLILQDGVLCKTIWPSYLEEADQASMTPLQMLFMPESMEARVPPFEPRSESSILTFNVPFEKNKHDYKPEDIQPFVTALQEPDFFIDGLYIYAYSSIEGDSVRNAKLQRKRAESMIDAFKKMQQTPQNTNIITNDSWGLFLMEMEGTQFDTLTKLSKRKTIKTINTQPGLLDSLEPYLAKQRFAQIVLDVTYDISGEKEEKFSIHQFNRAIKNKELKQAYKIQDYIHARVNEKKYKHQAIANMSIPFEANYSGVLMNQVVYRYWYNNKVATEEDYTELKSLNTLDPSNNYITFNTLLCAIKFDTLVFDRKIISDFQKRIDELYKTDIPKKHLNALNLEYQFKLMDGLDSIEKAQPMIEECMNRIKGFFDIKESNWQNNLKLAYVFSRFRDFRYAASLLEPYINNNDINEQYVFTYISICSQMQDKVNSRSYVNALARAKEMNSSRYCSLFGSPYLSFQVMDNPHVKKGYFENCK